MPKCSSLVTHKFKPLNATCCGDKRFSPQHNFSVNGQFHRRGRYIQTQFSNFNLAQTDYKGELSSFPLMNMFVPNDMLTWLYSFANRLISIRDIE